jgi:hypothetical protein
MMAIPRSDLSEFLTWLRRGYDHRTLLTQTDLFDPIADSRTPQVVKKTFSQETFIPVASCRRHPPSLR